MHPKPPKNQHQCVLSVKLVFFFLLSYQEIVQKSGPSKLHFFSSLQTTCCHSTFQVWWSWENINLFALLSAFKGGFQLNFLLFRFGEVFKTLLIVSRLTSSLSWSLILSILASISLHSRIVSDFVQLILDSAYSLAMQFSW